MSTTKTNLGNLSDEEILKEFVKRFECQGAVLMYLDGESSGQTKPKEIGFGRWKNGTGKKWVKGVFDRLIDKGLLIEHKI